MRKNLPLPMKHLITEKEKKCLLDFQRKKEKYTKEDIVYIQQLAEKSDVFIIPVDRGFGIRAYMFCQVCRMLDESPKQISLTDEIILSVKNRNIFFGSKELFTFDDEFLQGDRDHKEKVKKDLFLKWCRSEKNLIWSCVLSENIKENYNDYSY